MVDKHPGSVGRAPGAVRKENAALRLGTTGLNPESLLSRSAGSKKADLLITGIGQLVTMAGASGAASGPKKGKDSRDLGLISNAAVACKDGAILFAGSEDDVRSRVIPDCETEVIDAGGRAAIPGFVDAHTHLVFAGWRAEEYAMRCEGKSYLEIGAAGGGIASTVRATRDASYEHLFQRALGFLDQMLLLGTTSCEAKSGYGLDRETELKQLQVIARLGEVHPQLWLAHTWGLTRFLPNTRIAAKSTLTWSQIRFLTLGDSAWPSSSMSFAMQGRLLWRNKEDSCRRQGIWFRSQDSRG